jgi:phosphodiesterase/alkaline phosphatase D-like protein
VVATSDPTNIFEDAATLNGGITTIGSAEIIERGFEWDDDGSTPFTNSWTETGSFGEGSFSHGATTLPVGQLCYFRAKAKNDSFPTTWSYGNVYIFLTHPGCPLNFNALAGDRQVELIWSQGLNSDKTMVRRSTTTYPTNITDGDLVYFGTATSCLDTGLTNGTFYYYTAWSEVTRKSLEQYSFYSSVLMTQPNAAPILVTDNATSVEETSATLNGDITSGSSVYQRGFEWDVDSGWPYANNWMETGSFGIGNFSHALSSLDKGKVYYFRAIAGYNPNNWGWGDEVEFITKPDPPTNFTATGGAGEVSLAWTQGEGTAQTVIRRSTTGYPQTPDDGNLVYVGPDTQYTDGNLAGCTTYYYSAWSIAIGDGLSIPSDQKATAQTAIYGTPLTSTTTATDVGGTVATLNGNITGICDTAIIERGFDWGTGEPYANSWTATGSFGTGSFSHILNGLSQKTRYFYRAKSKNNALDVWSYGEESMFTTEDIAPSMATADATNVTTTSGTLNGNVDDMGNAEIVWVSFQWGTEYDNLPWETPQNPMTSPVGFEATINNLNPGTTYYYRAKGDGGVYGLGFGATMAFTTRHAPPSVSTYDATSVTNNSANLNGTLHYTGSGGTADVSFQYSTTSGIYSQETPAQTMSAPGDFTAGLTGLTPDTTYYYRAKAHNDRGTSYGTQHMFTTGGIPPSVATDNAIHITTNSADLNGNLTSLGTSTTINVSFQYGTTQGGPYTSSTPPQPMTATGAFNYNLTGLTALTTYYFVAQADGGINGTDYGTEKSFRTSMFPPSVETMPATGTTDTASTLNGNLRLLGSAATVNVSFEYGNTHGGPYPISTPPQAMTATGPFLANLSGLTPGTTYYYRAKGDGGEYGVGHGDEMSFTTSTLPPSVTTNAADNIASDSARLNGNLSALGDAATVNVSFLYGTTSGGPYTDSTPTQPMTVTGAFQAVIGSLQANATYYFRAKADGGIYGISYGAERSFTTLKVPPSVATDNATAIAPTTATLHGLLSSMGTAPTVNVRFQYGTTPSGPYPNSTPLQPRSTAGYFHADITTLTPLTTYYFIARADGGEHGNDQGSECSFTTTSTPPSVFTGSATDVTPGSATLHGTLSSLGTAASANVTFQWGTSPRVYRNETAPQIMSAPGDFHADLTGLAAGITYYYRAKADGGAHGTGYGAEHAFTTSTVPPSVTTNAVSHKTTDSAALNGTLDALGTAATVNVSFVYGIHQGGPYSGSTPPQAMTATGTFQAPVTGLTPFTTYYYRAKADGGIYGTSYGAETSFTTNHLPPVVGTEGANDIMTNAAILNGDLYLLGTAATVNASFEWGTTHGGPYPYSTPPQAMNEPDIFHAHLGGLNSNTTYYFRAKADGGAQGIGYGEENVFTTGTIPPSVTTNDATDINLTSATLNGALNSLGSAATVNVFFRYGDTPGGPYPNSTPLHAMTAPGAFQTNLNGLPSRTAYYFRAVASGDTTVYGAEKSFITRARVSSLSQQPRQPRSSPASPQPIPPYMTIQYMNVNPKQASINQPVTILTNVVNTGGETGNYTAVLKINGQAEQSRTVSVGPQGTQPVEFTVTKAQPGTYIVNIGGNRDSFTILAAGHRPGGGMHEGPVLGAAMAAIVILLLCLVILLVRRRLQGY